MQRLVFDIEQTAQRQRGKMGAGIGYSFPFVPMPATHWPAMAIPSRAFLHTEVTMGIAKIVGMLLLVGGALGLVYGGFSYTKDSHGTQVGPIVLKVEEKQTVFVPIFISLGAMALGAFLVLGFRSKG
jgi:hypothetical protein